MFFRLKSRSAIKTLVLVAIVWTTMGWQPRASSAVPPENFEDAQSIVDRADRIRFPRADYEIDVRIVTEGTATVAEPRHYRVLSKGLDQTVVNTVDPPAERGRVILLKGRDLWAFLPSVSQPIRLSLSQRLIGQVAYGDLARANFTGDYTPKLLRTESIGGKDHYVLELTAVDSGVTYHRVVYWVEKGSYRPHKADFYAMSGRRLKTCRYEEFRPMGGEVRPARLVMEDALRGDERSVLEYSNIQIRELPDKYFTKDYLKKLAP